MTHPTLFDSLALGPVTLPNRLAVAPMCQYSAADGCATDWHLQHLPSLAMSGAGLVMVEATGVPINEVKRLAQTSEIIQTVENDNEESIRLGFAMIPGFSVNGAPVLGVHTLEYFLEVIALTRQPREVGSNGASGEPDAVVTWQYHSVAKSPP